MDVRRVLLVDDEAELRELVELVLVHMAGLTVISASSGTEALAVGPQAHADVILLDVMMPGLDGPATLARLRAESWSVAIPIAFMTAEAGPEAVARYKALGAVGVIAKPFDPMTLADQVKAVFAAS
jgi:two-component system OmpR family response regulator